MKNKVIIGNIIFAVSVSALVYLYIGYYRPKQKAIKEVIEEINK